MFPSCQWLLYWWITDWFLPPWPLNHPTTWILIWHDLWLHNSRTQFWLLHQWPHHKEIKHISPKLKGRGTFTHLIVTPNHSATRTLVSYRLCKHCFHPSTQVAHDASWHEPHPVINQWTHPVWIPERVLSVKLLPLKMSQMVKTTKLENIFWFQGCTQDFLTPQDFGRQSSHGVWQSQASPFPPWACLSVVIPGPQLVNSDGAPHRKERQTRHHTFVLVSVWMFLLYGIFKT